MPGRKLGIKCYIEGVQVPFVGARINITTNRSSTAIVDVIPYRKIFRVRPRTRIMLFFYDEVAGASKWRLLWEGEILGVGYSKTPNSRNVQLNCADLTNYWDYMLKYLINSKMGITVSTQKILFSGATKSVVSLTNQPAIESIVSSIYKHNDLPKALNEFLKNITDDIPYYQLVNKNMKLNRQIAMEDDEYVKKLIGTLSSRSLISQIGGRTRNTATVREILQSFYSMIYYNHVVIPSAPYIKNDLKSIVLKPNIYGTLPPACNMLFPDLCTSITYNRNFMSEPTRMWARSSPIMDSSSNQEDYLLTHYCAPDEIFDKMPTNLSADDLYNKFYFTDEEYEKGVIPRNINVPYADAVAIANLSNANKDNKQKDYMQKFVEYHFQLSRYSSRTLSVVGELNPWLICNFPCMVCDSSTSYLANIANISHTISANGGGHTAIQCNLAYEVDEDLDDTPSMPDWLNQSYAPENVSKTYMKLFNCDAVGHYSKPEGIMETSKREGDGQTKQVAGKSKKYRLSKTVSKIYNNNYVKEKTKGNNIQSAYHQAKEAKAPYSFSDSYRRRNIASFDEVMEFYGITQRTNSKGTLPNKIDGNIFNHDDLKNSTKMERAGISKRKIVEDYMDDISQSRGLDGR